MPWNNVLIDSEILAVHAALLPTGSGGQVLLFGGDEHWGAQAETQAGEKYKKTRLYDVSGEDLVSGFIASPDSDVFCAGHAFLPDGRLLIGGGTSKWPTTMDHHNHSLDFLGHRRCWAFNPFETDNEKKWTEVRRMAPQPGKEAEDIGGGRWYPTLTTLGNGEVIAFYGHLTQEDTRHRNSTPEKYRLGANNWTLLPQMSPPTAPGSGIRHLMYPRTWQLPSGLMFFATPMPSTGNDADGYFCTFYNPVTGDYEAPTDIAPASGWSTAWNMPAVMLPLLPSEEYRPRVMVCGNTTPQIIDLGAVAPAWTDTAARTGAAMGRIRSHSIAVLLPTGQVFHTGGVSANNPEAPVYEPELYTPAIDWGTGDYSGTDSWVSLEPGQISRNYHSTALLLPNGSIWTAGGNTNAQSGNPDADANLDVDGNTKKIGMKQIELYEPAYMSVAGRPEITSVPKAIGYGQRFEVRCTRADDIERIAFLRNGSATHGTDYDQRYVGLSFVYEGGDRLIVSAPPNGNVAPPGYYTLWVIDDAGNPCQEASFVRMAFLGCEVIADRSTFSSYEVDALLSGAATARFNDALYVVYDGFVPAELNQPGAGPSVNIEDSLGNAVDGFSLSLQATLLEDDTLAPGLPQRVTFVYDVVFSNNNAFSFPDSSLGVRLTFDLAQHICRANINLIKEPNPYMRDSVEGADGEYNPHWLSTDLRVFQIEEGDVLSGTGITHGASSSSPFTFLNALLPELNGRPENSSHPFLAISTDQQGSSLELARSVNGKRRYNYAIAKVRYRATAIPPGSDDLRVFFRMFKTAATGMNYNTATTYRRSGDGPGATPLLGLSGYELATIPFFAAPRVNTATQSMTTQSDPLNSQPLTAGGSAEQTLYFGCWLDINQTEQYYPIAPGPDNGPFNNRRSIQELIRGEHQCLVAELHFLPDPIPGNARPGNNDNLSQRNLAIVASDNPGSLATHTVQHTFELKASSLSNYAQLMSGLEYGDLRSKRKYFGPDQLMIRWHNIPRDSTAEIFFSGIEVDDILTLVQNRLGAEVLIKIDENTLAVKVTDITFLPIPPGKAKDIPGLISISLPDNVVKGEHYHATCYQVSGRQGTILGAFEISIPVSKANLLLEREERKLSVLRHISSTIPATNHWFPVFERYLGQIADRVDGFGGNADAIAPNPDGTGIPLGGAAENEELNQKTCPEQWGVAFIIGLIALLILWPLKTAVMAGALLGLLVLGTGMFISWYRRCCPSRCTILQTIQFGLLVALGILAILWLMGRGQELRFPLSYWIVLVVLMLQVYQMAKPCNSCDSCQGEK